MCRAAGFDIVLVETAGIGQSDTQVADLVDVSLYATAIGYLAYHLVGYLADGTVPTGDGTRFPMVAPYEVLPTRDGSLMVAAGNDRLFRALCTVVGAPELVEDPRDVRTLLKIGDLHTRRNKPKDAIEVYEKVAELYAKQGFFLKGVAVYKQILKLDPSHLAATLKLAQMYEELALASDALSTYEQAADAFLAQGQVPKALSTMEKMIALDARRASRAAAGSTRASTSRSSAARCSGCWGPTAPARARRSR